MESLYNLLQIPNDASKSDIKKAYFKLVRVHSPEKDPDGFKAIRHAYELLMDDDERARYDESIDVPDEFAKDFIEAEGYVSKLDFKEAVHILERLNKKYKNHPKIVKSLSEVYSKLGNTTKAVKILEALCKNDPNNQEAAILLANAYTIRGFNNKAQIEYERAIQIDPNNDLVWRSYIHSYKHMFLKDVIGIFDRAENIKEDMLHKEYPLYALVIAKLINNDEDEKAREYLEKYIKYYAADEEMTIDKYEVTLGIALSLSKNSIFLDSLERLVPLLEESRFNTDKNSEKIKEIKNHLKMSAFFEDDEVHDTFKDLTLKILEDCDCEMCAFEKLAIELSIVMDIQKLKKSLFYVKNNYPDAFKLSSAFYNQVLDLRKNENLLDKYITKYRKFMRKHPKYFEDMADDKELAFDEDFDLEESFYDSEETMVPFVKDSPKIGRNAPCPCGSGKKYKNCCGK